MKDPDWGIEQDGKSENRNIGGIFGPECASQGKYR